MSEVLEVQKHHVDEHLPAPTPDNGEGGEKSPMGISYGKTMMWYFLLSDAFTFSAFLIAYFSLRLSHKWWPDPNHVFNAMPFMGHHQIPMGFVSIMTFILIMSSVFIVRAVQEGHRMNQKGVMFWMFWGIVGGAAFLGCQAWDWTHLLGEGMRPFFNPFVPDVNGITHLAENHFDAGIGQRVIDLVGNKFTSHGEKFQLMDGFRATGGPVAFGALFFGITGFHGFHVFTGVCLNIWGFFATGAGVFQRRGHYEMIEKLGLYWHFVDLVWVFVFLSFYLM